MAVTFDSQPIPFLVIPGSRVAATVEEALGRRAGWEETAEALGAGFAEAFGLQLESGGLSDEERAWAEALRAEKYGTEDWTWRA